MEVRIGTKRRGGGGSDNKYKEKRRGMTRRKATSLPNRGVSPVCPIAVAAAAAVLGASLSTLEARTDL